jgi:AraC-like DNA-binding protein
MEATELESGRKPMDNIDHMMDYFDLLIPLNPPESFLAPRIRRGRYLFLNMRPLGRAPAVVCSGWEECQPDFAIERPCFRYEAIELLVSGLWECRRGKRWVRCSPGTLFVYGPGRAFALRARGEGPHHKFFLDLTGRASKRLITQTAIPEHSNLGHRGTERLQALFEQILSCGELKATLRQQAASALAGALITRAAAERVSRRPGERSQPQSELVFEKCLRYLETHYQSIASIGEAAQRCHVSPEYFSRLFRKFTGTTAERHLLTLRINHAARLLQQAGPTIKEISVGVGFHDPYHFSRAFKKVHGVSPRAFRQE